MPFFWKFFSDTNNDENKTNVSQQKPKNTEPTSTHNSESITQPIPIVRSTTQPDRDDSLREEITLHWNNSI